MSDYVSRSLEDVVALLAHPGMDDVLAACIAASLGITPDRVVAHADPAERVSTTSARTSVRWRIAGSDPDVERTASMTLLVVQSGRSPMTELLVGLTVTEDAAAADVATLVRRSLDALAERLLTA